MNFEPKLRVEDLSKNFGSKRAVQNFSHTFSTASITGIVGPNGCGKTTIFNLVTGFLHPSGGAVRVNGKDITRSDPWEIAKLGISRTFQQASLFDSLTVSEHLEYCRQPRMARPGRSLLATANEVQGVLLGAADLRNRLDSRVSDLSYGQRKIIAFLLCILSGAQILLLDEPISGLAPHLRGEVAVVLRNLASSGHTIIIIEHNFSFLKNLADSLILMADGRLIADGSPAAIQQHKDLLRVYLG